MRITVSHNRTKEEVVQTVDRSFNDLFQGIGALPVRLVQEHKSWQGSTLTFALTAKMGLLSTPIKGTVEVTDRDITIDADLGILERMIPAKKAQEVIGQRVRGLLK
jgi:Putative polyhydroxyalkanoic acid system protein (PHA_gran_rgn)